METEILPIRQLSTFGFAWPSGIYSEPGMGRGVFRGCCCWHAPGKLINATCKWRQMGNGMGAVSSSRVPSSPTRYKRSANVDSKLLQFVAGIVAPKVSHAIGPQVRRIFEGHSAMGAPISQRPTSLGCV